MTGDSEEDARVPTALPDDAIVPGASRQPPPLPMRKRPRPGERRVQILETLATMLQEPGAERVTTAALAAKLDVSEAALYRHFASKEDLVAEAMARQAGEQLHLAWRQGDAVEDVACLGDRDLSLRVDHLRTVEQPYPFA